MMTQISLGTFFAFAVNAILVENVILTQLLGCCPFFGVTDKRETALGMGMSVTLIMGVSSIFTYCIYHWLLVPLGLQYLRTVFFVLVIAVMVQLVEMLLKRLLPALYKAFGLYLPLITTNCAVIGVCINNIQDGYNFITSFLNSVFTAIGFTLVIWIFSLIRSRIEETCDVPEAFRGLPIALIAAALLSFGFMGFNGLSL